MTITLDEKHTCTEQCQHFRWLAYAWCVTYALDVAAAHPDKVQNCQTPVEGFRSMVGLAPAEEGKVPLLRYTALDTEHAKTVDLTKPLLVGSIYHPRTGKHVSHVVIDGWHRIYRALTDGVTALPARVLDRALSERARISAFIR